MCTRLQSPKASCSLFSRSALILICLSFYRACRRSLPNPTSTHLTSTYNQGHSTPNLSSCSYTISSPFPRRISRPHHLAARAHIQQITSDRTRRRIRINHQYIPAGARLYRSRAQKCPEHTRYRASPRVTPLRHRNGRPRDSEQQRQPRYAQHFFPQHKQPSQQFLSHQRRNQLIGMPSGPLVQCSGPNAWAYVARFAPVCATTMR